MPNRAAILRGVGTLSNGAPGGPPAEGAAHAVIRPVADAELPAALRLIFCTDEWCNYRDDDAQVRSALSLALSHRGDAGGMRVAVGDGRPLGAVLPIIRPGRSMQLYISPGIDARLPRRDAIEMIDAPCRLAADSGVLLAQALPAPSETGLHALLREVRFSHMADLVYMATTLTRNCPPPAVPDGLRWRAYDESSHALFSRTVLDTYADSRDCPAMNGRRDINDVIADYRGSEGFAPALWHALCDSQRGVGVVLLGRVGETAMEVMYLGVVPEWRRRGVGDLLMRQALATATSAGCRQLILSVDVANTPALRLYWRHGMEAVAYKMVFVRFLESPLSPVCQHGDANM